MPQFYRNVTYKLHFTGFFSDERVYINLEASTAIAYTTVPNMIINMT